MMDATTRSVMEAIDGAFPRPWEGSVADARRRMAELTANLPVLVPVDRVEDTVADGVPVRVYRPDPGPDGGPLPLLVWYHGGGFVLCSLDSHDNLCRTLATALPAVVVSVDYRLAPDHRYPAAPDDCYRATRWAHDHASELGADPSRLAVGGDSAGGNLAAVTCLMARDRGGPPIAFQLLVYPVTDLTDDEERWPSLRENAAGYFHTTEASRWYHRQYLDDPATAEEPYASPVLAPDLGGLPPTLVITAEYDPLRDEGEGYGHRLREAGVPATVHRSAGMFHGFFSMGALLEEARDANQLAVDALRRALGVPASAT